MRDWVRSPYGEPFPSAWQKRPEQASSCFQELDMDARPTLRSRAHWITFIAKQSKYYPRYWQRLVFGEEFSSVTAMEVRSPRFTAEAFKIIEFAVYFLSYPISSSKR